MLLLIAPIFASMTWQEPVVLTVEQVAARIKELDGQTILVRGRLSEPCGGLSCSLDPQQDSETADGLSLAGGTPLEPVLNRNAGRVVTIEVKVDASCNSGTMICLDRSPDLTPLRVLGTRNKAD